jgi:hypothetical protein
MPDLFDPTQQRTLQAALDRLIPKDDYPGAWEAGCGDYICGQLNGQLAHLAPTYQAGLDGLEAEAQAEFAQPFADLSADQQDVLLGRVEEGSVRVEWDTPPRVFFSMLVNHTAEGYYADPAQGGNRDRASWRMVGFNGR